MYILEEEGGGGGRKDKLQSMSKADIGKLLGIDKPIKTKDWGGSNPPFLSQVL